MTTEQIFNVMEQHQKGTLTHFECLDLLHMAMFDENITGWDDWWRQVESLKEIETLNATLRLSGKAV